MEKTSAETMLDMVVDEKNKNEWARRHEAEVKATMAAFDGLMAMLRGTVEADARRRAGGIR